MGTIAFADVLVPPAGSTAMEKQIDTIALRTLRNCMPEKAAAIYENWQGKAQAAMKHLFDMERGVFVSGPAGQISAASQVWFVLSGIMERQQSRALLDRISTSQDMVRMVTPYMFHHYVHALFSVGMTDKARETMNIYWGGMVEQGADTFYELFNPENPNESPYGSSIVNSYCHAWSCTPAWFLRCF